MPDYHDSMGPGSHVTPINERFENPPKPLESPYRKPKRRRPGAPTDEEKQEIAILDWASKREMSPAKGQWANCKQLKGKA